MAHHGCGGGTSALNGISFGTKTGWGGYGIVKAVDRSLIVFSGQEGGGLEVGTRAARGRLARFGSKDG